MGDAGSDQCIDGVAKAVIRKTQELRARRGPAIDRAFSLANKWKKLVQATRKIARDARWSKSTDWRRALGCYAEHASAQSCDSCTCMQV